jgi:hypothetical protein
MLSLRNVSTSGPTMAPQQLGAQKAEPDSSAECLKPCEQRCDKGLPSRLPNAERKGQMGTAIVVTGFDITTPINVRQQQQSSSETAR